MSVRLALAILSTLIWAAILVVVVLFLLPRFEIRIPLAGLIGLAAALGAYAVISYRVGSRALRKKPVAGLPSMIGSRGRVLSPLTPQGTVKIKGELWEATTASDNIDAGEEVIVVAQDSLTLTVGRVRSK